MSEINWGAINTNFGQQLGNALDPAVAQERNNKLADLATARQLQQLQVVDAIQSRQSKIQSAQQMQDAMKSLAPEDIQMMQLGIPYKDVLDHKQQKLNRDALQQGLSGTPEARPYQNGDTATGETSYGMAPGADVQSMQDQASQIADPVEQQKFREAMLSSGNAQPTVTPPTQDGRNAAIAAYAMSGGKGADAVQKLYAPDKITSHFGVDRNGNSVILSSDGSIVPSVDANGNPVAMQAPSGIQIYNDKKAMAQTGVSSQNLGTGDEFLANIDPTRAAQIKQVIDGKLGLNNFSLRINLATGQSERASMIADTLRADPSFDSTDYSKRQRTATAFASGAPADKVKAVNQALAHASLMADNIDKLDNFNGIGTPLNYLANYYQENSGHPEQGNFKQTAMALASELRRVFAGASGGSLEELRSWESSFNLNASKDQQKAYLQNGIHLLGGGLDALSNEYQTGMGRTANFNRDMLSPAARASLAKLLPDQASDGGQQDNHAIVTQPVQSPPNRTVTAPPEAIAYLRAHPETRANFERHFGAAPQGF